VEKEGRAIYRNGEGSVEVTLSGIELLWWKQGSKRRKGKVWTRGKKFFL